MHLVAVFCDMHAMSKFREIRTQYSFTLKVSLPPLLCAVYACRFKVVYAVCRSSRLPIMLNQMSIPFLVCLNPLLHGI